MEKNPKDSEEKETSSETGGEKMKVWFQENLRMIVSIAIVVAIAGGIYSYSKRTQPAVPQKEAVSQEGGEGKISVIGGETAKEEAQKAEGVQPAAGEAAKPEEAVSPQTSQETESSFIETAVRGDSTTKLARRALANYLEKNPDTNLTAAHKIFIEDLLRRQVADGHLKIGDTREFSKDSIAKAIEKSKTLNDRQLKNLQKFAQRVPGLGT